MPEGFELRDALEVLGPARRALEVNQHGQVDEPALEPQKLPHVGVRLQGVVRASPCGLAENIQIAGRRGEREVQAALDCLDVERERQPGRRTPKIRPERRERVGKTPDVVGGSPIDDVQIDRQMGGAMSGGRSRR